MGMSVPETVEVVAGGVTTPQGFRAAAVSAGIKAQGKLDLALLVSDAPATAAGVFTTNRVQAAPVLVSKEHLARSGQAMRAVVVNSGCANACTGEGGMLAAREMAAETARLLGCRPDQVIVASTGVIGVDLDVAKIRTALPGAVAALAADQGAAAARAIMTTDSFPKEAAVRLPLGGGEVSIGGMAKGAGMIEPMMATMLSFLATDAAVPAPLVDRALREAVSDTFNAITVDGECSTNDSVVLFAGGGSGITVREADYGRFVEGLKAVCLSLALDIVRNGEGATKLVTVTVTGARTVDEARRAARVIANSPLVKTAIHGGDPNWGRLIAAAGRAGVALDLSRAAVQIGPVVLFRNGRPHDDAAPDAATYLERPEPTVTVDLGSGDASATMWTCDLSADYVRINADYRT